MNTIQMPARCKSYELRQEINMLEIHLQWSIDLWNKGQVQLSVIDATRALLLKAYKDLKDSE